MAKFQFLCMTDSETDDGYRVVEGENMEAARLEWVRQITEEGQKVHLSAIQRMKAAA